jgi:hypothetical protein
MHEHLERAITPMELAHMSSLIRRLFRPKAAWAHQLDFVGPRAMTAWWAWGVLGLGVFAALFTFDEFDKIRLANDEVSAQIRRLERADRRVRLSAATSPSGREPLHLDEPANKASAQLAIPLLKGPALAEAAGMSIMLGYPWGQALADIEQQAVSHQAVLLGLSVSLDNAANREGFSANWRVQAAVRDDATALAWVAQMPDGQLLSRERLPQPFEAPSGRYELKVNAQMRWPGAVTAPLSGVKKS